jgi:hypothetical protein
LHACLLLCLMLYSDPATCSGFHVGRVRDLILSLTRTPTPMRGCSTM